MSTIRAYTTIEQSRKLADILPLESADYCWGLDVETLHYNSSPYPCAWKDYSCKEYYIPCWSLAALLDVLPKYELYNFGDIIQLDINREALATEGDETLLDLVVNMIIHLHELKALQL